MPAPYRRLGRIVKAHGTQGEVSIAASDRLSLEHLGDIDLWIVPPPASGTASHRLTDVRDGPKGLLARISGIATARDAHELAGRWLIARADDLPEAEEEPAESYVGLDVRDTSRGFLGSVSEVIVTGANDVLIVTGGPFGEVLIPVIDQVVLGVEDSGTTLVVKLLDGLIEEDVR